MNISQVNALLPINSQNSATRSITQNGGNVSFSDILTSAIDQTEQTKSVADEQTQMLLSGDVNNLHEVSIASTKAELALNLTIQIRNKVVDAYNEVMRMQV